MKRKRYSEEQIIEILKLHNARREACGLVPPARDQRGDAVPLAEPVWRDAGLGRQAAAAAGRGKTAG